MWVLVGEPIAQSLQIRDGHFLTKSHELAPSFRVAALPRQPFILEPGPKLKPEDDFLYSAQQPVGEYELMLYSGEIDFFHWHSHDWDQWLILLADRIQQLHLNPYLHFVTVNLSTKLLKTVGGDYQRVGDVIASSHPLAGMSVSLDKELAAKILATEELFVVRSDENGSFYVPTAPLHKHEIWYLPHARVSGVESIEIVQRKPLAKSLSELFSVLNEEFPSTHWQLTVHTAMAGSERDDTWWIQIYEDGDQTPPGLVVHDSPERFVFTLKHLLAHREAVS